MTALPEGARKRRRSKIIINNDTSHGGTLFPRQAGWCRRRNPTDPTGMVTRIHHTLIVVLTYILRKEGCARASPSKQPVKFYAASSAPQPKKHIDGPVKHDSTTTPSTEVLRSARRRMLAISPRGLVACSHAQFCQRSGPNKVIFRWDHLSMGSLEQKPNTTTCTWYDDDEHWASHATCPPQS